jgi:hypothetical protein
MNVQMKLLVATTAAALFGAAGAQTGTSSSVGRAASAAVTPGDQNMGNNPNNRSGGVMGTDRTRAGSATTSAGRAASAAVTPGDQNMGNNPGNRSGGLMGNDRTGSASGSGDTSGRRAARPDRG